MRKLKLALLFVLMLCIVVGTLVACDNNRGGGGPVNPPSGGDTSSQTRIISGAEALSMFKNAALNMTAGKDNRYINLDTVLFLDYIKDDYNRSFSIKIQFAIDLADDSKSEILMELWRMNETGEVFETLLVGFYYYDATIVYDCRGIKNGEGVEVVKTSDIDMSALVGAMYDVFGDTDIAELLFDKLLGTDTPLGTVEDLLATLLGSSRYTDLGDGRQKLEIPLNIPGGVLGAVLGC